MSGTVTRPTQRIAVVCAPPRAAALACVAGVAPCLAAVWLLPLALWPIVGFADRLCTGNRGE